MNGTELVFKKPREASEEESDEEGPLPPSQEGVTNVVSTQEHQLVETTRITIVDDD